VLNITWYKIKISFLTMPDKTFYKKNYGAFIVLSFINQDNDNLVFYNKATFYVIYYKIWWEKSFVYHLQHKVYIIKIGHRP
jgi:hypothetical protein